MRIAITSTGNSPQSKLDKRFGRSFWFAIYDTTIGSTEFIPNPYRENIEGAGFASIRLLVSKGVDKVVSGEFGVKVKSIFDQYKTQLIILKNTDKKISDIIELLNKKK
jgi:predicted Fe-Mo cluster-binding NifX family protein